MTRSPAIIRQAHVDWLERAYERSIRKGEPGIPHAAVTVGVWLVNHGWHAGRCRAERECGWGADRYRLYASALTREQLAVELAEAERILFTAPCALMKRWDRVQDMELAA